MKRILIVGASSFIGSNLAIRLREKHRVFGTYAFHRVRIDDITTFPLPLTPESPIEELISTVKPEVVVYCAGERSEEACLRDPLGVLYVNTDATVTVARTLQKWRGRLIFLSSSKVFSGEEGNYREDHEAKPNTQYGISKLKAEELLAKFENVFILRLGTIFGMAGKERDGVANRLLDSFWENKPVSVINDEFRSFVSVDDACRAIQALIEAKKGAAAIYHLGALAKETYFDFAAHLAKAFGFSQDLVRPVAGSSFSGRGFQPANRGRDLSLNGSLLRSTFGIRPAPTAEALSALREKLRLGLQ